MIERTLVHVGGPAGAGKTALIEHLLRAAPDLASCMRAQRDPKLRRERESKPRSNAELRRYRAAGAVDAAQYRFPEPSTDAFFESRLLMDYSRVVFVEGDLPLSHVDLSIFVAPVPARGGLLHRQLRDQSNEHRMKIEEYERALESNEAAAGFFAKQFGAGDAIAKLALLRPEFVEEFRSLLRSKIETIRHEPPPAPTEHWALAAGYEGIERAQLVVINVRSEAEQHAAQQLIEDVRRLRQDDQVFDDVIGLMGSKVPITVVIADLSDPRDAGLKKAVARLRRVIRSQAES